MTSVFLSAKVENVLKPYDAFKDIKNWPSRDVLLELEFALSRGIQFDYMVYHPYFPLRGVMLDMQEHLKITRPRGELSALFQKLFDSAESAKEYVNAAILTDLIFTHSPAQIAWGALLAGAKKHDFDDDVERYISARLVEESPERRVEFRSRLQEIAEQSRMQIECDQKALKAQAGEIDKKLKDCRNPEFDRASLIYQRNVEAEQEVQRERKRRKVEEAQARQKDRERVFD
ncbi:hypothetical protein HK104_005279 [Borealophlyctis nickersoniae]|nr:hypothetical protein HK104_005279 [Borealophlyctis nickersoniae]